MATPETVGQGIRRAAAEDQEIVDEFDDLGAGEDDLPEERDARPRAGGKTPPDSDSEH